MTTTLVPDRGPMIWIVEKGYGPHEPGADPVFASHDGDLAKSLSRVLGTQETDAQFTTYAVPLVVDAASAQVERLTLRQTPSIENVVVASSETIDVEWTFGEKFAPVEVEDRSTATEIVVTGHDHALVRGMFAALVEAHQERENDR